MSTLRTFAEVGLGLLFLAGAVFNAVYTSRHGEFYGSFAEGAFMPGARRLVDDAVIPNAAVFTVALVLFEAAVAVLILSRGDLVRPALLAGACFALVAAYASSPGGAVANLGLGAALLFLAFRSVTGAEEGTGRRCHHRLRLGGWSIPMYTPPCASSSSIWAMRLRRVSIRFARPIQER